LLLLLLLLLRHLVGELEGSLHVTHGLHRVESRTHSLLRRHDAHVHVLLLSSLNLLLLLLEQFDLLLNGELFHARVLEHAHQGSQFGRTPSMGNVQPSASRTLHTTSMRGLRRLLLRLLLLGLWCLRRLLSLLLRLLLLLLHEGSHKQSKHVVCKV
jgi:hypothetical protein